MYGYFRSKQRLSGGITPRVASTPSSKPLSRPSSAVSTPITSPTHTTVHKSAVTPTRVRPQTSGAVRKSSHTPTASHTTVHSLIRGNDTDAATVIPSKRSPPHRKTSTTSSVSSPTFATELGSPKTQTLFAAEDSPVNLQPAPTTVTYNFICITFILHAVRCCHLMLLSNLFYPPFGNVMFTPYNICNIVFS